LVEFIGGTARNAIPREAVATIAIKSGQLPELEKAVAVIQAEWQKSYKALMISCKSSCSKMLIR
jgi:dipeptidase D